MVMNNDDGGGGGEGTEAGRKVEISGGGRGRGGAEGSRDEGGK